MPTVNADKFLEFVWTAALYEKKGSLYTKQGLTVSVYKHGQPDDRNNGVITGVHIEIDGVQMLGSAVVTASSSALVRHRTDRTYFDENTILIITLCDDTPVCRTDGSLIPTIELTVPQKLSEKYASFTGSVQYACAEDLTAMDRIYTEQKLTGLAIERLREKYEEFAALRTEARGSWDEAFYITLFKTMGRGGNRDQYVRLAKLAPYIHVCRIKQSQMAVEALLLGTAGLLWPNETDVMPDDYTVTMQKEFNHLAGRFGITPMRRSEWKTLGSRPQNHPCIRIAQLAAMLCSKDFLFDKLIECADLAAIRSVLAATASDYWTTHYRPGKIGDYSPKSIGTDTLDSMAINLVVPMMFAYGNIAYKEHLKEKAIEILENIAPEKNKYTDDWKKKGIMADNAFFSQALIQLSKKYCPEKRCAKCVIGKMLLGRL